MFTSIFYNIGMLLPKQLVEQYEAKLLKHGF